MATGVIMEIKGEANSCLITRDFLGVCFGIESKELDLDLHVPNGWEKRLDLKSGKVYIERTKAGNESIPKRHDLNMFSHSSNAWIKARIGILEQQSLDLKLITKNSPTTCTSVCTLDKVKSALDRDERASASVSASPSSTSSSSSSSKRHWSMMSSTQTQTQTQSKSPPPASFCSSEERESSSSENRGRGLLVAAACPACLLYVLIMKNDPKCPKCTSLVHLPVNVVTKKPNIDLNISI